MVTGFDTIMVVPTEMERSARFYEAILGKPPQYASTHWTSFDLGEINFALHHPYEGGPNPGGGIVIIFRVPELKAFMDHLANLGVPHGNVHEVPAGRLTEFRDPDGNVIQAIERD
jgi:catechol 2,3-dioxygenase-like lactoylglutathione lyase family enzyme